MIRSRRTKPRPGRVKDIEPLRFAIFIRDKGRCVKCGKGLQFEPRFHGDPDAYDMAHKRNKRMWGDTPSNLQAECHECHMEFHSYGPSMEKPCPAKR
jgi:5-methylcytosine-specific restriction endonuclease McrA